MTLRKSLCSALFLLSITSAAASAQTVSIGTNPQGSLAYSLGSAISKVAIEKAGVQMRVVPRGGPTVTLPLVNAGELDFSVANSVVASFAPQGKVMFAHPNKNLRAIARIVPLYAGFLVRGDSDIHTLADLKGKRVASGFLKQKIVGITASAVLNTVGLSYKDVDAVVEPNGLRGVEDLEAGNVDATFFSIVSGRTIQADAAVGGIRVLPVAPTTESLAKIDAIAPSAYVKKLKPSPGLPGIKQEQGVFTSSFVLMVSASVPDDVVYKVTKALYENKTALAQSSKAFNYFEPESMGNYNGVAIHPGAMKFYTEKGLVK